MLWIDDRPANNEYERKWLRPYGLVFDNVVSTDEALEQLSNDTYDLVITDLGRRGSSDRSSNAGVAFLEQAIVRSGPPVIVYASRKAEAQGEALRDRGAGGDRQPGAIVRDCARTTGPWPRAHRRVAKVSVGSVGRLW